MLVAWLHVTCGICAPHSPERKSRRAIATQFTFRARHSCAVDTVHRKSKSSYVCQSEMVPSVVCSSSKLLGGPIVPGHWSPLCPLRPFGRRNQRQFRLSVIGSSSPITPSVPSPLGDTVAYRTPVRSSLTTASSLPA